MVAGWQNVSYWTTTDQPDAVKAYASVQARLFCCPVLGIKLSNGRLERKECAKEIRGGCDWIQSAIQR